MNRITIDKLKDDSLFHFTERRNLKTISEYGLVPTIGENAHGIENTPKIFFSRGEIGILKVSEVWLRWLMNRIYGSNNRLNIYKDLTPEKKKAKIEKWNQEFLSGEYLKDEKKKEKLFAYYYEYLKKRTYLTLDIKEGEEYDLKDIDENKVALQQKNKYEQEFARVMYSDFSNMDDMTMDSWNMHTKTDKGIKKNKIRIVETPDNKDDVLSILLYVYNKNKGIPHKRILLDDFIKYVNKKKEIK